MRKIVKRICIFTVCAICITSLSVNLYLYTSSRNTRVTLISNISAHLEMMYASLLRLDEVLESEELRLENMDWYFVSRFEIANIQLENAFEFMTVRYRLTPPQIFLWRQLIILAYNNMADCTIDFVSSIRQQRELISDTVEMLAIDGGSSNNDGFIDYRISNAALYRAINELTEESVYLWDGT